MSLNLNSVLYSANGVDKANVVNVANKILNGENGAQKQVAVQNIDYSKFNRPTLGVDLYSSRTNVDLQRQVAMTQAGLYQQSVNVAQLNSQAAANLYSAATVQKNVGLTQSVESKDSLTPVQKIETTANIIQTLNIQDKNPNSSNGFNPFASAQDNVAQKADGDNLTLFA